MLTYDGRHRFGRHRWRSTGAVFLSAIGLEIVKIQMLARWRSPIVTHYTRLAPLKTITADFRRAVLDKAAGSTEAKGKGVVDHRKIQKVLNQAMLKVSEEIARLDQAVEELKKSTEPPLYVKHLITKSEHRVLTTVEDMGTDAVAVCGFAYARRSFRLLRQQPTIKKLTCGSCMPELKASLPKEGR